MQVDRDISLHLIHYSSGNFSARILRDRLILEMCGMRFPRNHRLFAAFDKKFEKLFTAGIVSKHQDHWSFNYLRNPKRYEHLSPNGPRKLTLEHLEAGFVIWLISVSIAVMVFLLQWIVMLENFFIFKLLMLYKPKQRFAQKLNCTNVH